MTTANELPWNPTIENEDYELADSVENTCPGQTFTFFKVVERSESHVLLNLPHLLDARTLSSEIQTNSPKPAHRFRHTWKERGVVDCAVAPVEPGSSQYEPHTLRLEHDVAADQSELLLALHGLLETAHATRIRMEESLRKW